MLGPSAKIWLHRVGTALGIAGVAFVVHRLYAYHAELSFEGWGLRHFAWLALFSIAYGAASLPLAMGWHALLALLGSSTPVRWAIRTYAVTQLAKYVPGNIFHFAGRHAVGAAAGVPHGTLLKSAVMEILLQAAPAICLAPILLPILFPELEASLAFAAFAGLGVVYATMIGLRRQSHLVRAAVGYATQVGSSSFIFFGVFMLMGGTVEHWIDGLTVIASFAVAWLVGMLTPGAPAGIGVREAALVVLLVNIAPSPVVLTAALWSRVVTALGDLLFFLLGQSLERLPGDASIHDQL